MLASPITMPSRHDLVREIVACLAELRFPVHGSVPYLVELLDSADDTVVLAALEYLEQWRLVAAREDVRRLVERSHPAPDVRRAAARTLDALDAA